MDIYNAGEPTFVHAHLIILLTYFQLFTCAEFTDYESICLLFKFCMCLLLGKNQRSVLLFQLDD